MMAVNKEADEAHNSRVFFFLTGVYL